MIPSYVALVLLGVVVGHGLRLMFSLDMHNTREIKTNHIEKGETGVH